MTKCSFCINKADYNFNDGKFYCDKCMDEKNSPWIKVTDRLPENKKPILLYESGSIFTGYREGDNFYPDDIYSSQPVTHWMELPEAPHD